MFFPAVMPGPERAGCFGAPFGNGEIQYSTSNDKPVTRAGRNCSADFTSIIVGFHALKYTFSVNQLGLAALASDGKLWVNSE
jgi:hypothetical protein